MDNEFFLFLLVVDLFDRVKTASLFQSFKHLLEKVGIAVFVHTQKPLDIQVFQNIFKSMFVLCISIPALQTVG